MKTAPVVQENVQPNGSKELLIFLTDSRLHFDNNLRLAYHLLHVESISVSNAARLLDIRRADIYTIIHHNPCFQDKLLENLGYYDGWHQRRIILSPQGRKYGEHIRFLAEYRLSGECSRLVKKVQLKVALR